MKGTDSAYPYKMIQKVEAKKDKWFWVSEVLLLLKMNILYFDEREIWSPKLDEVLDEIDESDDLTISKVQMQ